MNEDICVIWGDREFIARRTEFRITGKVRKDSDFGRVWVEPLGVSLLGESAHIGGSADVKVDIRFSREMIYDLFDRMVRFESEKNSGLAKIGKALVKELKSQGSE